jgi:acetyl esterase/lipase
MDDTVAAFQWLKRNAAKYRVDPSHIALGGASAGGVLALRLAYSPRGRALGIRAVLALSAAASDPLTDAMRANDPPLLIVHGTNDTLLPFANAVALDAQASKAGLPHRFVYGEGRGNGHIRRMQLPIDGLTLLDHIVSFFNDCLAPK